MSVLMIRSGFWELLQQDAVYIREQVFIQEQNIPIEDEWDEHDSIALHFVMYANQQPIATARLLENNSVGRVAVLKNYRGQGIGKHLMLDIINQAKIERRAFLKLSAQTHAISFYAELGFQVEGNTYLDCGIPHIQMSLPLKPVSLDSLE